MPVGNVIGWRSWLADERSDAEVDLLVESPQSKRKIFRVSLNWVRGDWRLILPNVDSEQLFTVRRAAKEQSFTPFFVSGDQ